MKTAYIISVVFALAAAVPSDVSVSEAGHSKPLTVELWPNTVPGIKTDRQETELPSQGDNVTRITHVSNPSMTVFKAPATTTAAPAVIVCPGGGYSILAINKEGTEAAEWLNSIGITALVLKYRVPKNRSGAFQDAQRAMRMTRYHAADWGIDPNCIGILGFSAGGHLAARASTDFQSDVYPPADPADRTSSRPDFTILIYPAYLSQKNCVLSEEITVTPQTPPAFIVQTQDDRAYADSSVAYYTALTQASVPAELHLFEKGGHGYGLRPSQYPVSCWPRLCEAWMKAIGVMKQPAAETPAK